MTVAIIDYGVGNLFSLTSVCDHLGVPACVTDDARLIETASHVILPGVGAFGDAIERLRATGLVPVLDERVRQGRPLLGICLGMQLLFERSFEYGEHAGLAYLPGDVVPLEETFAREGFALKVPHMGWNRLDVRRDDVLLAGVNPESSVYFVHSFYADTDSECLVATAEYGVDVPAIVAKEALWGCQFHPEKSGEVGLQILRNFFAFEG